MEIGWGIRKIRAKKGWSQAFLAKEAGLSQQHVSLIENRKIGVEWETVNKILEALGCELVLKEREEDFKSACERRALQWEKFAAFESRLALPNPARALSQAGALAQLFSSGSSFVADSGTDLERSLRALASFLQTERVPYMIIGGVANLVWGVPRATLDIDVTIWVDPDKERDLAERMAGKYVSLAPDPAFVIQTRVLPLSVAGFRVDVIFAGLPYEERAIRRARTVELAGVPVRVCSPEDLIFHKILAGRPKDLEDIRGIVRALGARLDRTYLDPLIAGMARDMDRPQIKEFYLGLFS